jgi:hypothetical protein
VRYGMVISAMACLLYMSSSASSTEKKKAIISEPEPQISASQFPLDSDVLRNVLENYCHPLLDLSTRTHKLDYNRLIEGVPGPLMRTSTDSAGNLNARVTSVDMDSNNVKLHFVDINDNTRVDYILTKPVQVIFNYTFENMNGYGQHIGDYITLHIENSGIAKDAVNGVIDEAYSNGLRIDLVCTNSRDYLNLYIAKQLNISGTKTFFDTLSSRNWHAEIK